MTTLSQRPRRALVIFAVLAVFLPGGCRESGNGPTLPAAGSAISGSGSHSYSTAFPEAENPISESGNWISGSGGGRSSSAAHSKYGGRLWGDVQTTAGFAFGVDEPTEFGDPSAILTGSWGPTQTATAKVRVIKAPVGDCCHEVELRLRSTIRDGSITGYEAYCSVMPNHRYCHIARWNGPNGSYWNFEPAVKTLSLADGDIMKATATGTNPTVITLYRNGEQILQAIDTGAPGNGFAGYGPWTSGNPGIGFFDNHDDNWKDFGFSEFSATDVEQK